MQDPMKKIFSLSQGFHTLHEFPFDYYSKNVSWTIIFFILQHKRDFQNETKIYSQKPI